MVLIKPHENVIQNNLKYHFYHAQNLIHRNTIKQKSLKIR
ncbi:hypothetical protein BC751_3416 [Cecembia calidifontis]|uniref:Uncharacterized protein n=1 Tax=Cecembia calidifontis TaxID=1187080 RepID=A0A4V2F6X0_9BACT|nr:hypothetical protein BC751_3416 [Cecembia calidifontis]